MTSRNTPLPDDSAEAGVATLTLVAAVEALPFAPSPEPEATFTLLFHGRDGVSVAELRSGDSLTVGRAAPAEVVVDDPSLSRLHARLTWQPDGVQVEDLGSKNGIRVAGLPVQRASLEPGAALSLADVAVTWRRSDRDEVAGLDTYDRFHSRLLDELGRARGFRRSLALFMLRAPRSDQGHAGGWSSRVRAELRVVDSIGLFAPNSVLVLVPEIGLAEALHSARELSRPRTGEPVLCAGVAVFPDAATSAEELVWAALAACRRATPEHAVECAPAVSDGAPESGVSHRNAPPSSGEGDAVIVSPRMAEIYRLAHRAALGNAPVLVLGETGTGKELVARSIHDNSPRRAAPLRAINCAAIPATLADSVLFGHERGAFTGADRARKGIFEDAHGGTVFLDEVGELSPGAQAMLLRVLETKRLLRVGSSRELEVDVRVVAATRCDLEQMVAARTFRADLLHRLNLLTLELPPLRARREEIEPLSRRFFESARLEWQSSAQGFAPETLEALQRYSWPGNVRELRNVVERAVMLTDSEWIQPWDLPESVRAASRSFGDESPEPGEMSFGDSVRAHEVRLLVAALERTAGNQKEAARLLQMPLRTLVHKVRAYALGRKSRAPDADPS